MKEDSAECGDKDIMFDDLAHPGTIFFNSLIDNLKESYGNSSIKNEEGISHSVSLRYDEYQKKFETEKNLAPQTDASNVNLANKISGAFS